MVENATSLMPLGQGLKNLKRGSFGIRGNLQILKGSVSGSGTGSLDSEARDPVPDLETQSLEVRYRIPRQPYEDCLGVRELIVSYLTVVIFGLISQYFNKIFCSGTFVQLPCNIFLLLFMSFIQNNLHLKIK